MRYRINGFHTCLILVLLVMGRLHARNGGDDIVLPSVGYWSRFVDRTSSRRLGVKGQKRGRTIEGRTSSYAHA